MKRIRVLAMDVDGTLTDGKIYMSPTGECMKAFCIKDGYGIKDILPQIGVLPLIITGRESRILTERCKELNILHCYQGVQDKERMLKELLKKVSAEENGEYTFGNVAYCGDDCNDLPCMIAVKNAGGKIGCPKDAVKEVCAIADFIASKNGGDGAVREFIEWLREAT